MGEVFWDSSVLVALCVAQPITRKAERWAEKYGLVVWWAARVEVASAIAPLYRSGELTSAARLAATSDLHVLTDSWNEIAAGSEVRAEAQRLLPLYALRAADSLQLAAALIWCRNRPEGKSFLCADARLCDAAERAGFSVLRP